SQSMHLAAFTRNMPLAANNVPINTMPTPAQLLQDGMSDGTLHGLDSTHTFISFRSRHPGGAQFALCDGSVRMLPQTIDYRLYCNLGTRAGGEAVAVP
ncbi:MAG: DUF1559 domain-containing protein, partial [Pirellulaceae bacterium]|nr:DUF1559 domain-containing protein [Pirellulaceae bacterium]